jgi:hypothetical protein
MSCLTAIYLNMTYCPIYAMSQEQGLEQNAIDNLELIEEEIETSSQYFKPKPGKTTVIRLDPQNDKIVPIENDRFKDANGKPIKRYQFKITHVTFSFLDAASSAAALNVIYFSSSN